MERVQDDKVQKVTFWLSPFIFKMKKGNPTLKQKWRIVDSDNNVVKGGYRTKFSAVNDLPNMKLNRQDKMRVEQDD